MTRTQTIASSRLNFKAFTMTLFLVLFVYLVLRAWLVEPLKDELMTYFFFIEPGRIVGQDIILDANNHILNSFLARFFNGFDNGNYFLLRIPNLLAFPLYFWGIHALLKDLGKPWQRFLVLTSIICIPFTLEYFAACRGYGLALGFFVWTIVWSRKWLRAPSAKVLLITYFFAWFTILSNLTYLTSGCICAAFLLFFQLVNFRNLSRAQHLWHVLIHLGFFASLIPFVQFAERLKEAGAFYYGSLDGFWPVTCKTVLRYTIFYDGEWMKYPLGLFFLVLIAFALIRLFKHRLIGFSRLPEAVYYFFLAGNVAAIFFMAKVLKVNYPEDRVAMHLVPLTLLLIATLMMQSKRFSAAVIVFTFFPIAFLWKINLDSSVISPDDRMNTALYEQVRETIGPDGTVAGYYTMPLMWTWMERRQPGAHMEMEALSEFSRYHDVVMTKDDLPKKPADLPFYTLMAEHKGSRFKAWKRTKPISKTFVFERGAQFHKTNAEFLGIASVLITDSMRGKPWFLTTDLTLQLELPYRDVLLSFATIGEDGAAIRYEHYQLNYGHGLNKKRIPVHQHYIYDRFEPAEKEIRVYIWNPQRSNMYFYDGRTKFYEITPE